MKPKTLVIGGYGFNADAELAQAFTLAGADAERLHLSDILAEPGRVEKAAILAFPGGFSFGDHLGSGRVVALLCRQSLRPALERFAARGGLVIGICNGFQCLVKMGMLPNRGSSWEREVTLAHNTCEHYVDAWVGLHFEQNSPCLWTRGLADRMLPIRHGEGRFRAKDQETLAWLESEGLVAARYAPGENPNGSEHDIAGICDPSGRIFGLMPHPEAFLIAENHPWRRRRHGDRPCIELFENGVREARGSA